MRSFRLSLIALLIFLTLVFNMERLDIGEENLINIQTFVYVLVIIIIMVPLMLPVLGRANIAFPIAFWLSCYALLKYYTNIRRGAIFGGVYTYLTVTELSLLIMSIILAKQLISLVDDIEDTVKNIVFADRSSRVLLMEEAENEIKRELYRSRRFQHPLSIIVLEPRTDREDVAINRTVKEVQQSMKQHYVVISVARVIDKLLRRTDLLLEHLPKGRIILLSPETNSEEAVALDWRIRQIVEQQHGIRINSGIASFPQDALTFEELISHAESLMSSKDETETTETDTKET
jgi:GGDEF domain-containing protein